MATQSQKPKGRENSLSLLNAAIEVLTIAKEATSATPAQVVFGATVVLLARIKVSFLHVRMRSSGLTRNQDLMLNEMEYVELGLFCANICKALDRGMRGKKLDDLSQTVCDAINQLTK